MALFWNRRGSLSGCSRTFFTQEMGEW